MIRRIACSGPRPAGLRDHAAGTTYHAGAAVAELLIDDNVVTVELSATEKLESLHGD